MLQYRCLFLASLLAVGCQDSATPDCREGFVKKQGRWCVFDEDALVSGLNEEPPPSSEEEPEEEPETEEEETTDPSEYVYDATEPEALLSLDEIREGIEDAIRATRELDPALIHDSYEDVRADGDDVCPAYDEEYYTENDRYLWRDACTVTAGGSFSGYAYSYYGGNYIDENETYEYDGHGYFNGSARVIDSRGYTFIGAGYSSYWEREHITGFDRSFSSSLSGNFRSDHPMYADTWLAQDLNVALYHSGTYYADDAYTYGGGFSVYWNSSISGMTGEINSIRLQGVYMYSESVGSMCEIEPAGSISVRDSAGNWYEAEFDGPKYYGAGSFPPDCDSCGPVYWRGELLGEVCPDFTLLNDWEERPWL
jgi:hypothetical protein